MKVKILFDTEYELTIDLLDSDFVKRWSVLLQQEIEHGTLLQEDTFSNFVPEDVAKQRLEQSIHCVNKFLRREFIKIPKLADYDDPAFYNQLHEKFEKLAGPDWDRPTKLMLVAPDAVKLAVRHVNRYCHRLERRPYQILSSMRVEFNTHIRKQLCDDDYRLFKTVNEDNVVILDYSTLGKSLYECFQDGLPPNYHGMKEQHHYCANFILKFRQDHNDQLKSGFYQWLNNHNIIPKTAGQIQLGNIADCNAIDKVRQCAKIVTIKLE
jgi:hypothetical protein